MVLRVVGPVIVVWLVGFVLFAANLPASVADSAISPEDGIVVPTGGAARIATGFDLLASGGKRMLITGVYPNTTLAALEAETGRTGAACCIDLDHDASDTAGNAQSAAAWAERYGIQRLRLVTSWYHMPRSLLLFRHAMPTKEISPYPVFPQEPARDSWWRNGIALRLIVGEYHKFLWAWLRAELEV